MKCSNKAECAIRHEEWLETNKKDIAVGQIHLEDLQQKLEGGYITCLSIRKHTEERLHERGISLVQLKAMLINGWAFEYYVGSYEKIGVVGYIKVGVKDYRPLHVILKRNPSQDYWHCITVYDPRTRAFRWDASFENRKCFCHSKNSVATKKVATHLS